MNCTRSSLFRAVLILFLFVTVSRFYASDVLAGGYKIPEQSANSVGLGAAYVANASGPDSAYYNPANMVWSDEGAELETSLNFIYLPGVDFNGTYLGVSANTQSRSENVFLPNVHFISPKYGNTRLGFSLVYPFGLSKRWDASPQRAFFKEFTLEVVELDISAAFMIDPKLSVGWGIRGVFSKGIVKGDGSATVPGLGPISRDFRRELKGDDFSPGYFVALSYKAAKPLMLSTVYRSKVTPNLEGNATLSATGPGGGTYSGPTSLEVVLPATWQVAVAYTLPKAVFELVYERTYWSAYQSLDFEYGNALNSPVLSGVFDTPIAKNWKDSDTYRFGFTYHYNAKFIWLMGLGYDETPVPESSLNFELPDSNAILYSTGLRYQHDKKIVLALGYLLSQKKDRSVTNTSVNGRFESNIHIVNASLSYAF